MLNFQYKGIAQGKYVEGEIEAINNSEAAYKLKEQKIIITKLIKAKKKNVVGKKKKSAGFSFGSGVKTKEILIFAKQFSTMQKAGLPILTSLNLLIEQTQGPNLKKIITQIKKDLEAGNALSACFQKHPKIFDIVTVNLIKAGEASGKLDIFFERIVYSLEKREKIKAQIKSALFYPGVLLSVALLVTTFMLIKVVPTFVDMYTNMGLADKLPNATKIILSMSNFIRAKGFILLLFIIAAVMGLKYMLSKNYALRKAFDKAILHMPVFGNLIQKSILARVSLVLGNLNQAGVDILESLDIAKSVTTNIVIVESIENIKKGVFSGKTLTELFEKETIFPPTFSQLISVGEQTGSLDTMFASVAKYYEEEFDTAVGNLAALIEPIMIVFMGATIGGLMVAMYAPIMSVGELIQ